jgi:two-component system, sensor histidine kinase PdtaS
MLFVCSASFATNVKIKSYLSKIETYRYTKYFDSAHHYFNIGLPLALKTTDSILIFDFYKKMGDAYEHYQFLDSTLMMYAQCEKYIPTNNYTLKSFLLNDKAYTYRTLGDYDKSTALILEALHCAEQQGDLKHLSTICMGVAGEFSSMKMNARATQYYLRAIDMAQSQNDTAMLAYGYRYYGIHLLENNQLEAAHSNLMNASRYSSLMNDSISLASIWFHSADYYWQLKKIDSCFYFAKKAAGVWERRNEQTDLLLSDFQLGTFYLELNNYEAAALYFKKAESSIQDDAYFNEQLYNSLAKLFEKKGDVKQAFYYLNEAKKCSDLIRQNERKSKVMSLRIKFDTDQKEAEIMQEKEKNELSSIALKIKTAQRNIILLALLLAIVLFFIIILLYIKIKKKNNQLNKNNLALEELAKQKQILFKEVHHRVKNNLTTLKSLFYLQAKSSDKADVKLALEECQLRIQSMALIHQSLYEENEHDKLLFSHFLKQLFSELELSIMPVDKEIEFEYIGAEMELDISKALFLGLIINELATNSYKYAFKEKQQGKITVEFKKQQDKWTVIYSDDGTGLAFDFEPDKGGFGFQLISILTEQIDATITYQKRNDLSQFTIEFSNEQ